MIADEYLYIVNSLRVSMERTTDFSVANTRVLRGFLNLLSYNGLRVHVSRWPVSGVAKWSVLGCDKARFMV